MATCHALCYKLIYQLLVYKSRTEAYSQIGKKSLTSVGLSPERQIKLSLLCIKSSITEMPNDSLAKTEPQVQKKFLFSTVTKQSVCRLLASSSTGLSLKHGDIEDLSKRKKRWTQTLWQWYVLPSVGPALEWPRAQWVTPVTAHAHQLSHVDVCS